MYRNKTWGLPKCHVPCKAQNSFFGSEQLVSPHKQWLLKDGEDAKILTIKI
jgi:hypothetical protein